MIMQRSCASEFLKSLPIILAHRDSEPSIASNASAAARSFDFCYFDVKGPTEVEFLDRTGPRLLNIENAPLPFTAACGFIATTDATREKIAAFRTMMEGRLPWLSSLGCELLTDGEITSEGVLGAVVALLGAERQRLLERNASLLTRAATARRQFEHVQRTMVDLTETLRRAAPDGVVTGIEYLPLPGRKAGIDVPASARSITCTQRLPISLRGVAALDLFFDRSMSGSDVRLEIELRSAEDKYTHARWQVDSSSVSGDVIRLALPQALDTLDLTPIVSITGEGRALQAVRLGAPHPDPLFCCTAAKKKALGAPLAVRVRTAIPGRPLAYEIGTLLPVEAEDMAASIGAPQTGASEPAQEAIRARVVSALHAINLPILGGDRARVRKLNSASFANVRHLSPVSADVDFGVVYHWPEKAAVMVHPLVGITTVACLPGALAQNYCRITVWFESVRGDGPRVEVAAAVGGDDHRVHEMLRGDAEPAQVLISSWSPLAPGQATRAELFASRSGVVGGNLYLATRLAPGVEGHEHAWIIVRSVEVQ